MLRPLRFPGLLGLAAAGLLLGGSADPQALADSGSPPSQPAPAAAPTSPAGSTKPLAGPAAVPTSGLVTIESDSQQADNSTGVITAIGNVRIIYPDRRLVATARQAQYYSREGRLILSGDVDVIDADGQRIRAERLVYLLDRERLQAEPSRGRQVYSRFRLQSRPGSAAAPTLLP